jgi:site-specific DNA recombinase
VDEPKPLRQRTLQLEYRFDRLLPDKLAHVYQLLVPDRRQSIGGKTLKQTNPSSGVNDEQASSDLCARVLGSPEGESHHRQPDGCADRIRAGERIQRAARMVFQDEGYSGAILVRPGLEKLRDLAAEGQIAAALVYSPDRLSRKYAYQILLSEELSRCGVELIFLKAPTGATPEDQLLVQFQG